MRIPKLSKMTLDNQTLQLGLRLFILLIESLEDSDETNIFGINAHEPDKFGYFARSMTQFIEVCSWLGLMKQIRPKVSRIFDFLKTKSAKDMSIIEIQPSRLKSVLLYGNYNKRTMAAALKALCSQSNLYQKQECSIQHLAYIDLLGSYLHLYNRGETDYNLPGDKRLRSRIDDEHKAQLSLILSIASDILKGRNLELDRLSFLVRLLIVNRLDQKSEEHKLLINNRCSRIEKELELIAKPEYLMEFEKWHFRQIVYSYMVLFWCQRIWKRPVKANRQYLNWIKLCANHLLNITDPYYSCLLIKQVIAARKDDFLDLYNQNSMNALLMVNRFDEAERTRSIRQAIHASIKDATKFKVDIEARLTGGWSRTSLYRVKTTFLLPTVDKRDTDIIKEYVIKLGGKKAYLRADEIYANIPKDAQKLFVRHHKKLEKGFFENDDLSYIIMEFLPSHREYGLLIKDALPIDNTAEHQQSLIIRHTDCALKLIRELHSRMVPENPKLTSMKPVRVKIADIYGYENLINGKDEFLAKSTVSRLKLKIGRDEIMVSPINKVLVKLLNNHGFLTNIHVVPKKSRQYVLTHGDCHGYNIMIDLDNETGTFIDVEDVHIDDYLIDYADFAAHICFSMNLEDISEKELVEVTLRKFNNRVFEECLDQLYSEKWSDLAIIWEKILSEIKRYAGESAVKDKYAIARFGLFLGKRLLFIAAQSSSPIKSYILFIQGLYILHHISSSLSIIGRGGVYEFAIPPGDKIILKM